MAFQRELAERFLAAEGAALGVGAGVDAGELAARLLASLRRGESRCRRGRGRRVGQGGGSRLVAEARYVVQA